MQGSRFSDEFGFDTPALVNFVGGGGKTGLILRLMSEYHGAGAAVYITTTRIHPPEINAGLASVSGGNLNLLKLVLARIGRRSAGRTEKLTVTAGPMSPGLLRGLPPDFCAALDRDYFPLILNEADGARGMSIKMPREGEPVLMGGADYLVPVIGLDCINRPLGPQIVFRWDLASARHSLRYGEILTPALASSLLMHRDGVCRDWRKGTTIIPYINKVESEDDLRIARILGRALTENPNFPVERVVMGSLTCGTVTSYTSGAA